MTAGRVLNLYADDRFVRRNEAQLGTLTDLVFALAYSSGVTVASYHCQRLCRADLVTSAEMMEIWERVACRMQTTRTTAFPPRPDDRDELCFTINTTDGPDAA